MPEGQELEFTVDKRAIERKKDKVCIVGCADSKTITPFGRDDMEFWGVNNLYGVNLPGAHWDRWFEIHNIEVGPDGKFRRREDLEFRGQPVDEYLKGLAKLDCPVIYMQKHWEEVPNSIEYPLGPVTALFGRYFTNSISYQIALAILMGYEEIHVYGVDMAVGSEYAHQRPSCEFFLGWAMGRGIKVFIPDEADLLKSRFMYGFEERKRTAWQNKMKKVRADLQHKRAAVQQRMDADKIQFHQYIGAEYALGEMEKIWSNLDDPLPVSS